MRHGGVLEDAENEGKRVDDTQAGEVLGIAKSFLADGREVDIFDDGLGDLGRVEDGGEGIEAGIRHPGDADLRFHRADARGLVDAGEDGEQGCLARHGQADDCGSHEV